MRMVLIYFQDDRARRHQQKGRPPCGHPRTTRTIRQGQRGHLPQARRGSRGQSRSYVAARAQVRLAFSHLALPLPLFLSFYRVSLCVVSLRFSAPCTHARISFSNRSLLCAILHHASRVHTRDRLKREKKEAKRKTKVPGCREEWNGD